MANLVRDLMHAGVLTCRPDASLGHVAVMLARHHVHALVVANEDGPPLGIISDFDLLAGEWLSSDPESLGAMRKLTAADLMSHPIDTVEAELSLTQAAQVLVRNDVSRLLVSDQGQPVGIISLANFVASIGAREEPRRDTVGDVMSDAILVCRGKTSVISAARAMTSAGWRSVLVVDAKGSVLGVVSGKDLLSFVEKGLGPGRTVREVMHAALRIGRGASLREAADMMIKNHHHRLVVADDDDPDAFPLGVISSFDIVAEMARPGSVWQTA